MDGIRPTLPFLLDLNSSPSYHSPKQASPPVRPATTNLARNTSSYSNTHSLTKRSKKTPLNPNQSRMPMKSAITFYENNTKKQPETEDIKTFRFTDFQSIHKDLPRLYTPSQYDSASKKLNNLKERYKYLYVKPEGFDGIIAENIVHENLKEMVLEADKIFNATYSVKYFGLKDNTLGIVSKRIPMSNTGVKQPDADQIGTSKPGTAGRKQRFCDGKKGHINKARVISTSDPNRASKQSWGFGAWKEGDNTPAMMKEFTEKSTTEREVKLHSQPNDPELSPIRAPRVENDFQSASAYASAEKTRAATASNRMRQSLPARPAEEIPDSNVNKTGIKEEIVGVANNEKELNESYYYEQLAKAAQEKTQAETNPVGAAYVVTQYFVPKKLQSIKKKPEEDKKGLKGSSRGFEVKGNISKKPNDGVQDQRDGFGAGYNQENMDRIWQKVTVVDQTASNNADFERKVNSLGKVKRSLLRNVRVEKAWEARPYKDELDVQEKFRTYEVQKVMADNAKYSYAKLLETMQTNERPETALISNTEKMEKILSIRKEKRKVLASRGGEPEEFDTIEDEKKGTNGRYMVKVWYPKENEMFNRFVKIRANVDALEQEVS